MLSGDNWIYQKHKWTNVVISKDEKTSKDKLIYTKCSISRGKYIESSGLIVVN